jgi:acyl carrier protein
VQADPAIENEIWTFLGDNFPLLRGEKVDRNQSLVGSGAIDSLGVLELVEFIETRFGLRIPENELLPENLDSVANITRYLSDKLRVGDPPRRDVS